MRVISKPPALMNESRVDMTKASSPAALKPRKAGEKYSFVIKVVLYTQNLDNGSYPNFYLRLVQNIKEKRIKSGNRSFLAFA